MRKLKTLKLEDDTEEEEKEVLVVEAEDKKRRENKPTKKIGAKEDEVREKEVGWASQMLSALCMTSMNIMLKSATWISALVVIRSNILLKNGYLMKIRKNQPHNIS